MTRLLLARPIALRVGERGRVTHLVPVPEAALRPKTLTACCGTQFGPGDLELLDKVTGMPCEACLSRAAMQRDEPGREPTTDDVGIRLAVIERSVQQITAQLDVLAGLLAQALGVLGCDRPTVERLTDRGGESGAC
jgi:hypothetical protein